MVIVMFKFIASAAVSTAVLLSAIAIAQAGAGAQQRRFPCGDRVAAAIQSRNPLATDAHPGLLRIRDVQNAKSGGGGGSSGCWSACFNDFDACLGIRTKNLCVSRVKTCLETCDRLSNRPGM
jgi:hypothetical protein